MTTTLLPEAPEAEEVQIEDLTRRQVVTGALGFGLLIACGDDEDDSSTPTATPQPDARQVQTPMGPVEVPVDPERVVAIDPYASLQILDEIGAPLVAAGSPGVGPRVLVSRESESLPSVSAAGEVDLEAVAAANPDVIVGTSGIAEPIYDQLSEIAPTTISDVTGSGWREIALLTADAVNQRSNIEAMLDDIDERVIGLQAEIAESWPTGVTVTVLRLTTDMDAVRAYGTWRTSFVAADILGALDGVSVPADATASPGDPGYDFGYAEVSIERLRDVDADVILYYVGGFGDKANANQDEVIRSFTDNPLYSTLTAAQAGRVYQVDEAHWFWGRNVKAAHLILDDVSRYLVDEAR